MRDDVTRAASRYLKAVNMGVPKVIALRLTASDVEEWPLPSWTKPWLLLAGPPGTGKSVRAARHLIKHGNGRFVSAADLVQADRAAVALGEVPPSAWFSVVPGTLVLDDMGTEGRTEFAHDAIAAVLSMRYHEIRPTIITTNLDAKKIADFYGERTLSRIRELAHVPPPGTTDYRADDRGAWIKKLPPEHVHFDHWERYVTWTEVQELDRQVQAARAAAEEDKA